MVDGIFLNVPNSKGLVYQVYFDDIRAFIPLKKGKLCIFSVNEGPLVSTTPVKIYIDAVEKIYNGQQ